MKGSTMNNEISLEQLWKVFKAAWWKILVVTIIAAVIGAGITIMRPNKYASSTSFYINNTNTTSEYTTSSLLSAVEYLANDYVEIIHGDEMVSNILQAVQQNNYKKIDEKDLTAGDIRSMISSKTTANTSIFTITVTSTNKDLAEDVCKFIQANAPATIKKIARPATEVNIYYKDGEHYFPYENQLECVSVVRAASAPTKVSPGLFTSALIAAFIGAVLAYVYFFLRKFFDTTIRSSNDIKEIINIPVLADIPDWNLNESIPKDRDY